MAQDTSLVLQGLTTAAAAALLAVGALLVSRPLRADVASLQRRMMIARALAVGVVVAGIVVLSSWAAASLLGQPSDPETWRSLTRTEGLSAICILALMLRYQGVERSWDVLLAGTATACVLSVAGVQLLQVMGWGSALSPIGLALVAAVSSNLLDLPGRRATIVARARNAAYRAAGDGILVVDAAGRLLDANQAACSVLKLSDESGTESKQMAPKSIQGLLSDGLARRVRLKSASGRFLQAWTTPGEGRGALRGIRAVLVRDITTRHVNEQKLVRLAHYDSLTGLANRRLFLEHLAQALVDAKLSDDQVALLYIDLDHFKSINDSLGHSAGDALLQTLADRFRNHLRSQDLADLDLPADTRVTVSRLAGDEFAIVAEGISEPRHAAELCRCVLEVIGRPMNLADRTLRSTGSVGFAIFPEDGEDVETLIRHADAALYVAKARGRRRFARFEASFEAKSDRARLVEEGLQVAIERKELRVHYQPKVDLASGTVVGFEALLRWTSPNLGDVGPGEFIPVAESRGLICELGSWCLEETCRQLSSWQQAGLQIVPISVNVSSAQFSETDLQRVVSDALKRHEVDPHLLELELTESLLLDEGDATELCLRDLRAIGIRIALDDFGTGYSALTYLNRFNLDVLKMDRTLMIDIDSNSSSAGIASAVVSMAHSLGLTVVAEGIDMETQLEPLRAMKCDQIQGFLYAPALPADDARRFMARVGEASPIARPNASPPGMRRPVESGVDSDDGDDALPVLKQVTKSPPVPEVEIEAEPTVDEETVRVLIVDDGTGALGPLALRLGRLGIDIHYASHPDEALLFIAQEKESIRTVVTSPDTDLDQIGGVIATLTRALGAKPPLLVLGEKPSVERRVALRAGGASWVLWAPFNDAELRYLVRTATALPSQLAQRMQPRLPVDMVANIRAGDRREVAVLSSLSPSGAFIEMSDPLPVDSQLQLEFDVSGGRFRGFARVVYQQQEDPDEPSAVSGVGVVFFGTDKEMSRLLLHTVQEGESRYRQ
jgi:diguanylate cyclase (GGDEF)-like protein